MSESPVTESPENTSPAAASAAAHSVCLIRGQDGECRTIGSEALDEIRDLRRPRGTLAWLALDRPGAAEIELLQQEFNLHPLALEDLRKRNQRPKLDSYADQHMIVAHELLPPTTDERAFDFGERHLFAGDDWLVSVQWAPSPAIDGVRRRFEQHSVETATDTGALLYAILDAIVDSYFPVLDQLAERIDELQDRILGSADQSHTLRDVLHIKRELLDLRRVLAPMRDVANELLRRDVPLVTDAVVPYYQDLYDHLVRVLDQVDLYRDLMGSVLDARLTVASNSLNAIMKRLTAFTVVLMVPTLIAGIYGMNFALAPDNDWPLAFPFALALMAVAVAAAIAYFRRHGWF